MLAAVQAHAQVHRQNGVMPLVLVPVFSVKLPCVAPAGAAVFLARSAVLLCGQDQHDGKGIQA